MIWLSCKFNNFSRAIWRLAVRLRHALTGDCGLGCGPVTLNKVDGSGPVTLFAPEADCPIHDLGLKAEC